MKWTTLDTIQSLDNTKIITKLWIKCTNTLTLEERTIFPTGVVVTEGNLSFLVTDFYIVLTQGSGNDWNLELYAEFNYNPDDFMVIASSRVNSAPDSEDISYFGTNVMYINLHTLNWEGFADIGITGKSTTKHIVEFSETHKIGISKTKISEYVGSELNVNLHNQ